MSRCTLTPDCELGHHALDEHPCGQHAEEPGTPCRYCSVAVPMDGSGCSTCWTPATIPLLKALFAPYGLSVDIVRSDEVTGEDPP